MNSRKVNILLVWNCNLNLCSILFWDLHCVSQLNNVRYQLNNGWKRPPLWAESGLKVRNLKDNLGNRCWIWMRCMGPVTIAYGPRCFWLWLHSWFDAPDPHVLYNTFYINFHLKWRDKELILLKPKCTKINEFVLNMEEHARNTPCVWPL